MSSHFPFTRNILLLLTTVGTTRVHGEDSTRRDRSSSGESVRPSRTYYWLREETDREDTQLPSPSHTTSLLLFFYREFKTAQRRCMTLLLKEGDAVV
ncbi:hypothetical protein NQZ68_018977 [Dissostichus eleginoides]|nr:hypothetical protein NQZ68_018977 [Dissostichus eleginoides]